MNFYILEGKCKGNKVEVTLQIQALGSVDNACCWPRRTEIAEKVASECYFPQ